MICLTKHNKGAEILLDYGAKKLDAQSMAEIERHAQSCEECRGLVRAQRAVWQSLDEFAVPEVSTDFDQRLYARIVQEQQLPAWRQWISRNFDMLTMPVWKPTLAGAVAAALLAVGVFVHMPGHPVATQPQFTNGSEQNVAEKGIHAKGQRADPDVEQAEQALEDLDLLQPVSAASRM